MPRQWWNFSGTMKALWRNTPAESAWTVDCCCDECPPSLYQITARAEFKFNIELINTDSHDGAITGDWEFVAGGIEELWYMVWTLGVPDTTGDPVSTFNAGAYDLQWKLARTDVTPDEDTDETDFTVANFSGYAFDAVDCLLSEASDDWCELTMDTDGPAEFTHSSGATDNDIYTCYATFPENPPDSAGGCVIIDFSMSGLEWAPQVVDPIPMDCEDDEIQVDVTIALGHEDASTSGNCIINETGVLNLLGILPDNYRTIAYFKVRLYVTGGGDPAGSWYSDKTVPGKGAGIAMNGDRARQDRSTVTWTWATDGDDEVAGAEYFISWGSVDYEIGKIPFDDVITMDGSGDYITLGHRIELWDPNW